MSTEPAGVTKGGAGGSGKRFEKFAGAPKGEAIPALQAILARLDSAIGPNEKIRFEITVRWMGPDDPGPTAVTWSNKARSR